MWNQSQTSTGSKPLFSLPSLVTNTSQPQGALFGAKPQIAGLFGGPAQPVTSIFGNPAANQSSNVFGQSSQPPQQQNASVFGNLLGAQSNQPPKPSQSQFGLAQGAPQAPLQLGQTIQLGQTAQLGQLAQLQNAPPLWEEGKGLGVYRTIPAQIAIIAEKWNPTNLSSPLRTYLYQVVDEKDAPLFQPNRGEAPNLPLDDENKWEEAVSKRPGPNYVPSLIQGFWYLGKRAQQQREYMEKCNIRLHDINASLDAQLEIHNQRITARMAECRRKHVMASKRIMALAAKIQILRNRGYAMDDAEEALKARLEDLARRVLDPSLEGREQEIWARMLGIRERGRRLKADMEKAGSIARNDDSALDEETVRSAKKALEAYDTQLRHLQKELQLVQQEYEDWEKTSNGAMSINGSSVET